MTRIGIDIMQCSGAEKKSCNINKGSITVNGVEIAVEEKNIKHMHLSVYPPNGIVHISVPLGTTESKIRMYILQKWLWIIEKQEKYKQYTRQSEREYVSGEEHFWRGKSYRLKVQAEKKSHVEVDGDYIVLYVPEGATVDKKSQVLDSWYKEDLKEILSQLIEKWQKKLNVTLSGWKIERMQVRWGSCCNAAGKALFNLELAKKPYHCVEYIVAHELAHLLEPTHNDRFHNILFAHLPNWENARKELNEFII